MAPKRKKTSPGSKRKGDAGSVATTSTVIMAPKRKKTGPGSRKKGDAGSVATTSTVLPSEDTTGNLNQAPLDVQALTRTITSSVTEAVMANLRNAGLLPAADQEQPALTSGQHSRQICEPAPQAPDVTFGLNIVHGSTPSSGGMDTSTALPASDLPQPPIYSARHFVSSRLPLHATVPLKTKEKIWAGEFVELSTLQDEGVSDITFNMSTGKMATQQPKKKYMSIEQWTDAFNIYASVYRIKYPEAAEGLASYQGLIRRISNEHGSWFYYDNNCRRIQRDANIPWDAVENELFQEALSRKQPFRPTRDQSGRSQNQPTIRTGPQSTIRYQKCHKYNGGLPPLSRLQVEKFRQLHPSSHQEPTLVPARFLPENLLAASMTS